MKNIFTQLDSVIFGHQYFSSKVLCDPETAAYRFTRALKEAREYYGQQKHKKIAPELIHESWSQNVSELESYFVSQMSENFIANNVINGTMVFTNREVHKLEMKNVSDSFDRNLIKEVISKGLNSAFLAGKSRRSTLINSVHHLHHLMRFEQLTGRKISSIENVVEFGGGYGNMARIVLNLGGCNTYSIVDLLLFSCIQYVFLSTVAGNDQVTLDNNNANQNANIHLLSLLRTDEPTNLRGDLFLSTWALSESTRAAYDWVLASDWFGATNLLLAYNEHWKPWHENELEQSLATNNWNISKEAIPFLPGSFYLFATR
jgi:hypothetical protein